MPQIVIRMFRNAVLFLLCASTACLYAQSGQKEDRTQDDPITGSPDHPITRSPDLPMARSPDDPISSAYQSGIALAQMERWDQAHAALLAGSRGEILEPLRKTPRTNGA